MKTANGGIDAGKWAFGGKDMTEEEFNAEVAKDRPARVAEFAKVPDVDIAGALVKSIYLAGIAGIPDEGLSKLVEIVVSEVREAELIRVKNGVEFVVNGANGADVAANMSDALLGEGLSSAVQLAIMMFGPQRSIDKVSHFVNDVRQGARIKQQVEAAQNASAN